MSQSRSFHQVPVTGEAGPPEPAEILELFDILRPRATATPLVRIGEDGDGGYLDPDDLVGVTACFSPGVNNTKPFEDDLTDRYGIACHLCDFSSDPAKLHTPLREGLQTFRKKWLDPLPGTDNLSLESWVAELAGPGDLLLQMDIEGAEYRNILATPDEVLARFRVIVLEVHNLEKLTDAGVVRSVLAPFFRKLGATFTCVHAHPNNCCGQFTALPGVEIPRVLELTFVRHDSFVPAEGTALLPHPHDITRNVVKNPPLFLGDSWLDGERPLASRVKMLEDRVAYQEWQLRAAAADAAAAATARPPEPRQAPLAALLARARAGVRWRVRRVARTLRRRLGR